MPHKLEIALLDELLDGLTSPGVHENYRGAEMNRNSLDESRLLRQESHALRDKLVTEQSALKVERERTKQLLAESQALREVRRQPSRKY